MSKNETGDPNTPESAALNKFKLAMIPMELGGREVNIMTISALDFL